MLTSSNLIYPRTELLSAANSKILINPKVIVDLPLPVLPTTPIFSPLEILNEIPLMTWGSSSLYLYVTFSIAYYP